MQRTLRETSGTYLYSESHFNDIYRKYSLVGKHESRSSCPKGIRGRLLHRYMIYRVYYMVQAIPMPIRPLLLRLQV